MKEKNWHDKSYKILLLIPIIIILFSLIYLTITYQKTGDLFKKDISLTGGTSITVYDQISANSIKLDLFEKLQNLNAREIYDFGTDEQKALIIETTSDWEISKNVLEEYLGYTLVEGENSDIEFTGSILSQSFYNQLLIAILVAFLFMAIVVFIIFRNFIPSMAVILSAFADILMTLAVVDLFGLKMSTAGIVAFLMLIGYSVDTDILLTIRVLKRDEDPLNTRLLGALKTGLTMTLTSFFAILAALFIVQSFSVVLTQIFIILVLGLFFDMLNTWITNVSILKWYAEHKENKK
ncbi:preprotein translocase subunit SecF [Candidatus Pacearchaeota archaeon CG_4_9_14_3_um_filter_30_11]|nr:MAG: preprotein translocase subunit SecF [Candidatus Pacearchaeota archaeon CG11_big_fil_rev_8_21_14_0_20_30_13]PJA71507.1 MAG: preprotein translocase subunit SecF [Candidatus Pacearchaeota archaeon CG_4_9_14_3_um_filter_30_11]